MDASSVNSGILVTVAMVHQVEVIGSIRADTNWQTRQGQGFAAAYFVIDWEATCVPAPKASGAPPGRNTETT